MYREVISGYFLFGRAIFDAGLKCKYYKYLHLSSELLR